jgi:hypothetical protein
LILRYKRDYHNLITLGVCALAVGEAETDGSAAAAHAIYATAAIAGAKDHA